MPDAKDGRTIVPIAEGVVFADTHWSVPGMDVWVLNKRKRNIRVVIEELRPPDPPSKCPEFLDIASHDCCTILCDYTAVHEGPHRTQIGGSTVLWWPTDG